MKAKKKKPQDLTLRNLRAMKKTLALHRKKFEILFIKVWKLEEQIEKCSKPRKGK